MIRRARRTAAFAVAAVIVLAAACSDDDDDTTSSPATTVTSSATSLPTTPTTSTAATTGAPGATPTPSPTVATGSTAPAPTSGATVTTPSTPPAPVFGDPAVALVEIAQVEQPVGLAVRPGDSALYVVGQDGTVFRIMPNPDGGAAQVDDVADLTDRTSADGERGLLGLAFSADGTLAWVDYTDRDGNTVVAEYPVAADGTFDVGAERPLIHIDDPYPNHNGGDLVLGPDGMLYISNGDGGSGGDPERRASDPTSLFGKLLRIDPTPSGDAPYTIPADNPFASGQMGDVAGAPEVWSWGLRNPWRIAFDPATADLWIADVGQNAVEEINAVAPTDGRPAGWGANFGWSAFEGNDRYNTDVPDPGNLIFPVWTYTHAEGCSISGGEVYRGSAVAGLSPAYVYSDYCAGRVWAFDVASGRNEVLVDGLSAVSAVRTGPDSELYVLQLSGSVSMIVPA